MAHYDPKEGKIYGSEEGSLTHFHELGHKDLHERGIDSKLDGIIYIFILFFMTFSVFNLKIFMMVSIISIWVLYLYQEAYAWYFAIKKMREVNNEK
jgi:hypothetical protein